MPRPSINPDNPDHIKLEDDVTRYLESLGYTVDSAPYHAKMKREIVRILQTNFTPTGLYLRGRADRIAIKRSPPIVFEWEAKTHTSQNWHDWTMEALPLCFHIMHSNLGVRCLYIYRNPYKNHHCGFWVHNMPPIREIKIPPKWKGNQLCYFKKVFNQILPVVRINYPNRYGTGTDDPYLIIDETEVIKLPHWKKLIVEAKRECAQ